MSFWDLGKVLDGVTWSKFLAYAQDGDEFEQSFNGRKHL